MFSNVQIDRDAAGDFSGVLYSERRDAIASIHIMKRRSAKTDEIVYCAFLERGFIGEYTTGEEAIASVLFCANVRYAAGTMTM